jgi:hypothetical protein
VTARRGKTRCGIAPEGTIPGTACASRLLLAGLLTPFLALAPAIPAQAVEYRLEVVSLWESALYRYAKTSELRDGASGPGLERLEVGLDEGAVPRGVTLGDRTLRWASESVSRAYGTVHVLAEIKPGGDGHSRWDEVRWEGKPGDRSVWFVAASGRGRPERLTRVVLKGNGPPRQFMPFIPTKGSLSAAVKYSLNFLSFHEERGTIWERYVSRSLDLREGLGAVVGENDNQTFPDHVYLIVDQGAQPTTYRAVLLWRESVYNIQAPAFTPIQR